MEESSLTLSFKRIFAQTLFKDTSSYVDLHVYFSLCFAAFSHVYDSNMQTEFSLGVPQVVMLCPWLYYVRRPFQLTIV